MVEPLKVPDYFARVFVEVGVLFVVWKFRTRKNDPDDEIPAQLHGNTKAEIGWTALPAVLLVGLAIALVDEVDGLGSVGSFANNFVGVADLEQLAEIPAHGRMVVDHDDTEFPAVLGPFHHLY